MQWAQIFEVGSFSKLLSQWAADLLETMAIHAIITVIL